MYSIRIFERSQIIFLKNEENLSLICSNCDANLPTYKSKNKGNGRHYRRIKYKEGKSY